MENNSKGTGATPGRAAARAPQPQKKTFKIQMKLLFLLVPAVVVTITALVVISSVLTRKTMTKMAVSQLDSSIANQSDNIKSWLDKNLDSFSAVKNVIEKTNPDDAQLQAILDANYGFNKYCKDGPYVATMNGATYKAEESSKTFGDVKSEEWFKQGLTRVTYLASGANIFQRDEVLTSGKGGSFPAGLLIGDVTTVMTESGGQVTYGIVTPACDVSRLSQVFIIKDFEIVE